MIVRHKKNRIIYILTFVFAILMLIGCFQTTKTVAGENYYASDLFESFGPILQPNYTSMNSNKSGLRVSFKKSAKEFDVAKKLAGDFSVDFGQVLNSNNKFGIDEFLVEFDSTKNNQDFSVFFKRENESYYIGVLANGERSSIYRLDSLEKGYTSLYNDSGLFLTLSGETLQLYFEADTKCVFASCDNGSKCLVWDLSKYYNDNKLSNFVLNDFNEYNVKFIANSMSDDYGEIVFYSINNTDLSSYHIENTNYNIYANILYNGVVGENYLIPTGYVSNIIDGTSEINADNVKVLKDNNEVNIIDGSFTPSEAGEYVIRYSSNEITKEYVVNVYDNVNCNSIVFDDAFSSNISINDTIYIPKAYVKSDYIKCGEDFAKVDILFDNTPLENFKNVNAGFNFDIKNEGEYKINYTINNYVIHSEIFNVQKQDSYVFSKNLKKAYTINEVVDLGDICAYVNEVKYDGEYKLVLPDGKIITNKKFNTSSEGIYTILYTISKEGVNYDLKCNFEVVSLAKDLFTSPSSAVDVEYGKSNVTQNNCVVVTTYQQGLTFDYVNPINLSKYTNQSVIDNKGHIQIADNAIPLIEFALDPSIANNGTCSDIKLHLVDANDSNNRITIYVTRQNAQKVYSYVRAGATGQELTAIRWGSGNSGSYTYNENENVLNNKFNITNTTYGFATYHSFSGVPAETNKEGAALSKISLYYDNNEKQLYSNPISGVPHSLIVDFDNPTIFGDNVWKGFSSDSVYLSVEFGKIPATVRSTQCYIYAVDGISLLNSKFDYSNASSTICVEDNIETLTSLKGKTLGIPSAYAYDKYCKPISNCFAKVYYSSNGKLFDVNKNGNSFVTDKVGKYIIRYYAVDLYNNISTKDIVVNSLESYDDIAINFEVNSDYTNYQLLDKAKVMPISALNVTNFIADYSVDYKVYKLIDNDWQECNVIDDEFDIIDAGQYKVEYEVVDSLGRKATKHYEFNVAPSSQDYVIYGDKPVYVGFISNNSYILYDLELIDYTTGKTQFVNADIFVDGQLVEDRIYKAKNIIKDSNYIEEMVTIEYKYKDNTLYTYEVPIIPVVFKEIITIRGNEVERDVYHIEQYFKTDGNSNIKSESRYSVLEIGDNSSSCTFTNPIHSSSFSFSFDINADKKSDYSEIPTNISKVVLKLQDCKNVRNYIELNIKVNENKETVAILNGVEGKYPLSGSLIGTSTSALSIMYDNSTRSIFDKENGNLLFVVDENSSGEKFSGFSEYIYFTISIESNDGQNTSIRLRDINGSRIATTDLNAYKPSIVVDDVSGSYFVNDSITVKSAEGVDAFCDVEPVMVSVRDLFSGECLYSTDGVKLDKVLADKEYNITFEKAGSYVVEYLVKNSRNVEASVTYSIKVLSMSKPTIVVDENFNQNVSVNDKLIIPNYTVNYQNENDGNLNFIVVIKPTNAYKLVNIGEEYTFDMKGNYILRYVAMDIYGNCEAKEYKIVCN